MFQIWQDPSTGTSGLFEDLRNDEQAAFREAGMVMRLEIKTDDKDEANREFIKWCRQQDPGAKVERIDFFKLRDSWLSNGSSKKAG